MGKGPLGRERLEPFKVEAFVALRKLCVALRLGRAMGQNLEARRQNRTATRHAAGCPATRHAGRDRRQRHEAFVMRQDQRIEPRDVSTARE